MTIHVPDKDMRQLGHAGQSEKEALWLRGIHLANEENSRPPTTVSHGSGKRIIIPLIGEHPSPAGVAAVYDARGCDRS